MTKKVLFMLILATAGIASVNAQMRIGGEATPNTSAVLDLNPDDNVSAGNATLGLALPRVNLKNSGDAFPLLSHVKGMTIYNLATVSDVKPGVYVNNGMKWLRQSDSETTFSFLEKDSIVGNEVLDATNGEGLIRSGEGTELSPYTLGIAIGGVTTDKLADKSVTLGKLSDNTVTELNNYFAFDYHNPVLTERIINLIRENEKDSIVGNEVVDATAGGGLIRNGTGTTTSPFTLGVAQGGITTDKLANNAVTADKITDNAITTRHIENRSVTMEKLSDDVVNEILMHGGGLMPSELPNSILVSDAGHQWQQQQIPGDEILLFYQWDTTQPAGWIDLGYSSQYVPAGLYVATVQISQGGLSTSQIAVDCAVLDAGTSSAYSLISKQMDAFNARSFNESCIIYKFVPNNQVRLLVHTTQNTNYGLAAIILRPLIQLN